MSVSIPALTSPPAELAPELIGTGVGQPLERQVEEMAAEIESLRKELDHLRRRDETIKFYMYSLDEELRLAARLQQDFLPKVMPQVGPLRFHKLFRPAGYVSGDFYHVSRLDETNVGFYIADAVGHGMPAALLTMFIKQAMVMKEITEQGYQLLPPAETMARLNNALVEQHLSQCAFATALCGVIDTENLTADIARGGHPCPILLRANGQLELLDIHGSLLGVFENEKYQTTRVQLAPGDRLFVYTDGVEVAFSDDQDEGSQKWQEALQRLAPLETTRLLEEFCAFMDDELGSLQPKDDLTMLVIEALC